MEEVTDLLTVSPTRMIQHMQCSTCNVQYSLHSVSQYSLQSVMRNSMQIVCRIVCESLFGKYWMTVTLAYAGIWSANVPLHSSLENPLWMRWNWYVYKGSPELLLHASWQTYLGTLDWHKQATFTRYNCVRANTDLVNVSPNRIYIHEYIKKR